MLLLLLPSVLAVDVSIVPRDTLNGSAPITDAFIVRNTEYNGTSVEVTITQTIDNETWNTTKTINSYSYTDTSNITTNFTRVCAVITADNDTNLSNNRVCYPERKTPSKQKEPPSSDEQVSNKCEISIGSEELFRNKISFQVQSEKPYTYWVEDASGTVVKPRRESKSDGKKRYTPDKGGGYTVYAKNDCGTPQQSVVVLKPVTEPYLAIPSVEQKEEHILPEIVVLTPRSKAYVLTIAAEQEGKRIEQKIRLRGDERKIEILPELPTTQFKQGEVTLRAEGFGMSDERIIYLNKESAPEGKIRSAWTNKKWFEPFSLQVITSHPEGTLTAYTSNESYSVNLRDTDASIPINPPTPTSIIGLEYSINGKVTDRSFAIVELTPRSSSPKPTVTKNDSRLKTSWPQPITQSEKESPEPQKNESFILGFTALTVIGFLLKKALDNSFK